MFKSWHILNWNIRGINDEKKWTSLSNKIEESSFSILYLQETERENFDSGYIKRFCPKQLSEFDYLPSLGASGGILVVWNESLFNGRTNDKTDYSISLEFTSKQSGHSWILTNIYGPCQQDL